MIRKPRVSVIAMLALVSIGLACRSPLPEPRLVYGSPEAGWVSRTLGRMTLEEKVGQMIGIRYTGRFANRGDEFWRSLESYVVGDHVGGLCLFGGNVYETAILNNALQRLARVPLLIASDFERGVGNQVDGATLFPPLMALGAVDSEDLAHDMGRITALEARAMGIHMTYAPVVDVNINPQNPIINTRSVGEDPEQVSRLAAAFIRGSQEGGLLATAKHFPGHGDTDLDSHLALAVVPGDRDRLERVELYPFRRAVQAGVESVMVSHLSVPALDPSPDLPASLSPAIITDLLRNEMRFAGLIVSDAMDMGGVTNAYGPGEAAVKAVQAGIDLVLLPEDAKQAIRALVEAVAAGNLSEQRINASVRRILRAKAKLGLHKSRFVDIPSLSMVVGATPNLARAAAAFEQSITCVKNEGDLLPMDATAGTLAVLSLSSDAGDYFAGRPLVQQISARRKDPEEDLYAFYADAFTGQEYLDEAVAKAKSADAVIVALFSRLVSHKGSVDLSPRHVQVVKDLVASGVKVAVISFGSPYFLRHFPEAGCYLCAYRQPAEAQAAAAKALFGEAEVRGRLPVSLPELFPRGHGLVLVKKNKDM